MTLYIEGFRRVVAFPPAPIATGRSDPCRKGLAPSQEPCLSTAHNYTRSSRGPLALLTPSVREISASQPGWAPRDHQDLDADHRVSEPHDFSDRNTGRSSRAPCRSLTSCLALRPHAHTTVSRPPHPAPRFATIGRNAPLHRGGISETMPLICPTAQAAADATEWHDGQIAYGAHAPSGRRVS